MMRDFMSTHVLTGVHRELRRPGVPSGKRAPVGRKFVCKALVERVHGAFPRHPGWRRTARTTVYRLHPTKGWKKDGPVKRSVDATHNRPPEPAWRGGRWTISAWLPSRAS